MKLGRRRFLGWLSAATAAATTAPALAESVSPPTPKASPPVPQEIADGMSRYFEQVRGRSDTPSRQATHARDWQMRAYLDRLRRTPIAW